MACSSRLGSWSPRSTRSLLMSVTEIVLKISGRTDLGDKTSLSPLNSSNFIALPEGDDVHLELVVGPDVEDTHVLGQRLALAQRRGHGAARLRDEERLQRGKSSDIRTKTELVG